MDSRKEDLPADTTFRLKDYLVAAGISFAAFMLIGGTVGSFGLLIDPMRASLQWSSEQASRPSSIFFLTGALSALFSGWLIDRTGPKITMILAAGLIGFGLLAASVGQTMPVLLVAFAAAGTGYSASNVANVYVLARSGIGFGLSVGLMMFGMALGSALVPIGIEYLISSFGWRVALAVDGMAMLAVISLVAILLVPRRKYFPADTEAEEDSPQPSAPFPFLSFSLLMVAELMFVISATGFFIHLVPIFSEMGFAPHKTILMMSTGTIIGSVVPIMVGWSADRLGPALFLLAVISLNTLSVWFIHWLSPSSSMTLLMSFFIIYGMIPSSFTPLASMMVRWIVPTASLGRCYGIEALCTGLASAIGPWVMGLLADGHGYDHAITLAIIASAISTIPVMALVLQRRSALRPPVFAPA